VPDSHAIASSKLKAHYGNTNTLNDNLAKFKVDNPTFGHQLGSAAFYGKTSTESWNDAFARFWTSFTP
jgi:hypothetical protein